jgi:predicted permease
MVVAQVSLSLVLLVGAGLLVRTVLNMQREPTGFDAADVVVFSVSVPTGASPTAMFRDPAVSERLETTLSNVLREVRARPGVRTAARATQPLLDGSAASYSIRVEGQSPEAPGSTARMEVTDGFFESLGIPLRFGRLFTAGDLESPTQAAVVNEAFVRDFFPDSEGYADIVGRRFSNEESSTEIVGVVGDVKYQTLREPAPPMVYLAARPTAGFPPFNFILKTDQPLDTLGPELRTAVARVDPNATIENMQTQRSLIAGRYREERLMATVASAFGALVLAVSMIGLFGLMSYTVARRTREVGIRMALGAPATSIRRSVIRESLVLVCLAIIPGLAASLAATRVIESTLFGLAPSDPSTILGAVALLLGISTLAAYLPARRASRVDPAITLREE